MLYYPVIPPKLLNVVKSSHHMVLANVARDYPEYLDFYVKNPQLITMLDNGAWEGDVVRSNQWLRLIDAIKPNYVVMPDVMKNHKKTAKKFDSYVKKMQALDWTSFTRIGVAHGSSVTEWITSHTWMVLNPEVGAIAIPKYLDKIWNAGGRLGALVYLETRGISEWADKNYHAIGMNSIFEADLIAAHFTWVKSIDSALAVHAALHDDSFFIHYDSIRPNRPDDFFSRDWSDKQASRAALYVELVKARLK